MEVFWVLLSILCAILVYLYSRMRRLYGYWDERGVPYDRPLPLIGSALPMVIFAKNKGALYRDLYFKFSGLKYFGIFEFIQPQLVIRDPEIAGRILIKDFGHFVDHGLVLDEEKDWMDLSLFNLNGAKWRAVRNKIVPTFTTGKLKGMHPTMVECAEKVIRRLTEARGKDVDIKDAMALYSTEVIGSVVFGLDMSSPDPEFREMGRRALKFSTWQYFGFILLFTCPSLASALGATFSNKEVSKYFADIIHQTLEYRKKNNITRNDFVQLLLQLMEKGTVEVQTRDADDDYLEYDETSLVMESIEITEKLLIAQAYTFIMAGFEAMASSMMFLLLELSKNPGVQEKVRKEVRESVAKHGGYTYQALKEMTYLEMCMQETLRLWPLASFIFRQCNKRYRLDDGLVVEEGTTVVLPVMGFHLDPVLWPEPQTFDPERFAPQSHRTPFAYLPFGDGPRMCIGMRFALLQMKQGAASILNNFKIELSPSTKLPLEMDATTIITVPRDPIWLRFSEL